MKKSNLISMLSILCVLISFNAAAINRTATGLFASWSNPNTWTPVGVPTTTDDVIINGAIIQNGNVQVNFITILNGGGIINSGTIALTGSFTNNGTYIDNGTTIFNGANQASAGNQVSTFNNFVLNCTGTFSPNSGMRITGLLHLTSGTLNAISSLTLVNDGTSNGRVGSVGTGNIINTFTAERWMTKCDATWSEFGSCMTSSLSSLGFYYTGFPGANFFPSFSFINTYYYDETATGTMTNGYYAPSHVDMMNPRGQGLAYWFQNFSPQDDFPRVMPMVGLLDFQVPFDFNVQYTNSGSPADDGFNFLANPFPATIDWDAATGWTRNNIDNAVYVWDNCNSLYTSHAGSVSINGGSRYISEGQGFWVQTTAASPSLICTKDIISSQSANMLKTASAPLANVAYIKFNNDEIAVRLHTNGTNTVDSQFDAVKFYSDSSKIASAVMSNTTLGYAINTVFSAPTVTVPLITRRSGMLNFNGISSFTGYTVKLIDKGTNAQYGLTDNYYYWFNETDTTYKNRFNLVFTSIATGLNSYVNDNVSIYPNPANDVIHIVNNETNYQVVITDIVGKEIKRITSDNKELDIMTNELINGIYLINVISDNTRSTTKLVVSH